MTEIKRYEISIDYDEQDGSAFLDVNEENAGEWVRWEDLRDTQDMQTALNEKDVLISDAIARCREAIELLLLARYK